MGRGKKTSLKESEKNVNIKGAKNERELINIPRRSRKNLNASFFHVIVQGHKKEYIFEKERYIYQYIKLLKKYIKETNIKIVAYCIMNNHAHFLLRVENVQELSKFMHKINTLYARYYNYMLEDRVGYVYRDRFLSEPITSQRYLVECIKYIHNNPVKAKIVNHCSQYKFSSYNFFCKRLSQRKFPVFLSKEDYEDICNNTNYKFEFLDIEKNVEEIISLGIEQFLGKNKYSLYQIFMDRDVLRKLIFYLKKDKKLTFVSIREHFDMTRGTIQSLLRKREA